MQREKHSWVYDVLLIAVLAVAAYLRLTGADWGELQHQHPDEGFLVSVVGNLRAHECIDPSIPIDLCPPEQQRWMGIGNYFKTSTSTLNPHNRGYAFFVYGTLPLLIVRYTAELTGNTDFGSLKLMARQFSALADLGTIFLLYLVVAKLYDRRTALLAAAFSSFAVMQIQQSHFFTTDLFVNLFAFLAIYFAVGILTQETGNQELGVGNRESVEGERDLEDGNGAQIPDHESRLPLDVSQLVHERFFWLSVAFGFAFGLAMASKVNIFPLAMLLPGAFTIRLIRDKTERELFLMTDYWKLVTAYLIAGGLAAFLAFRIFQPYAFHGLMPSEQWLANIAEQRVQARGDADLPWNLQWARRSHLYSFENLTIWGLGLPLGILAWAGFLYMGWRIFKGEWNHALLWGWTAFYFLWQSMAFNPTMRYQLPIYPLLAMMAAWIIFAFVRSTVRQWARSNGNTAKWVNWRAVLTTLIGATVLLATAAWAFAFHTIYISDETRIAASRWIYQNIPGPINLRYEAGSVVQQPLAVPPETVVQDGLPYIAPFSVTLDVDDRDFASHGPLKEVFLPHVAAPAGTSPQTLTVSIAISPEALPEQVIGSSSVTADFSPAGDPRGPFASFVFDPPVPLAAGQTYFLKLETDGSPLTLSGAAVANETDYDYGLPFRTVYDGFSDIYRGDLNLQVYWPDDPVKLARLVETLHQADYIFIPTNHQYAQITRLPERYPLTTEYYRQLVGCPLERNIIECYRVAQPGTFEGNLGFDLVAVFESYPTLGPIVINDQAAEEAFTFYDHPKVFIFKKSADFDLQQVAAILGAVDLANVVHLTPREAASYKSMMLPEERLARQRAGGTWANLFDYGWLQNKYPVVGLVIWYLFVFLLGALTYPITRLVTPGLSDKGYALSRTLGLVILAYIPWLLGSLGVPHTRLTIGLVFAAIAVAGLGLGWKHRDELVEEWQVNRRQFLMVEGVFLSFFLFDLLIRLGNPDLWHPAKGGERPMDFSYLNAVIKSTTFPPYDPWFAGGYINYYYYGFVLVGTPVKLLGIVPSIAYNFILPTLFAIVATSAFSTGWNLVERKENRGSGSSQTSPLSMLNSLPFIAGLAAALLMAVLGNLGTIQMVFQALARLAAPGGELTGLDFLQRLVYSVQGFYMTIVQGTPLPIGRGEWYWNPSRVIPYGPGNEITEFPFFTFLYSDLHAHMIVLSMTTFVIAWALATVLARRTSLLSIVAGALVIGALYPTNLSDIYTYLPVGLAALVYAIWRADEAPLAGWLKNTSPFVRRMILTFLGLALLTLLSFWFYQPYRDAYSQAYRALDPWRASQTPIGSYLTHWGVFLFLVFSWLVWETRQWMAATPVSSLGKLKPYQILIEVVLAVFIVVLLYLAYRKAWIGWIALPLAGWAGLLLLRPDQPDAKRMALFWVGTAMLITIVVELFTVRGDIGRMNTIFKFYLQAWTLLAVSGGAALAWVLSDLHAWLPRWRNLWQVSLTILFAGAALYTVTATTDKVSDRMNPEAPHTLDSMTYMAHAEYWDTAVMDLSQDYRAIRWMQDNVQGSPVIVEGNCPEYRWCTRFTIYTGLPGVVGWNWHQRQQRALGPPTQVFDRVDTVGQFYNTTDLKWANDFLDRYDVRYIVVGQVEQIYYEKSGLDKFVKYDGTIWKEVYRDMQTVIYEVIR